MASVLCYCGEDFPTDSDVAACPACGTVATFPRVSGHDAEQMRAELDRLLAEQAGEPIP